METKMKGLLRGLRYISQIFDPKEQEMQIGYPTDVKHVAHIGWDGPSATAAAAAPSWMNEFPSATAANGEGGTDSPAGEQQPPGQQSRRNTSSEGPAHAADATDSPKRGPRQSRRHQSAGNVSVVDSPSRDSSLPEGSRRGRRHRTTTGGGGSGGGGSTESSSLDEIPAVPKQSRRRKPKGSSSSSGGGGSGGGSTRSGRSKAAPASHSDPAIDNGSGDLPAPLSPTREEDGF